MINKVTFLLLTLALSMVSIHAQGTGINIAKPSEKLEVVGSMTPSSLTGRGERFITTEPSGDWRINFRTDTIITDTKVYADSVVIYRDATSRSELMCLVYNCLEDHSNFYKDKLIYTVVDGKLKLTKKLVATKVKREVVTTESYIKYE